MRRALTARKKWRGALHGAAALWVAAMLYLALQRPDVYDAILQEDGFVEWLTATCFVGAGILRTISALQRRRPFDLLIAGFCLFVGGEEFSWGQRLLGFTPPDAFLAHNTQQELTLHNFADVFGQPKAVLIICLLGYALFCLPEHFGRSRNWLPRLGATPPPCEVATWLVASAALLAWYPVELTGEWVEALAGFLFLVSAPASLRARITTATVAVLSAALLAYVSSRALARSPARLRCAHLEARALLADVVVAAQTNRRLLDINVHKRLLSAVHAGYLPGNLAAFRSTVCAGESGRAGERRRRYLVDPWGMAYWVESYGGNTITVYSFGPNRNRDGDDISASISLP